ncbi:MAG: response regulator [Thermodesulfovibrionales bacterium]
MSNPFGMLKSERQASILVVDDIRPNLELMEAVFGKAGYQVHTALNAADAFGIVEKEGVDLAVLDVMMPGMNGFDICRALKKRAARSFFPVILLTALNEKKDRIAGLEAGADDFISKPFDVPELLTKIRSLLRLKELHEELDHSENIIFALIIAMEARDGYTKGHSTRVGDLAREFGAYLGFASKDLDLLQKAGMLHDIGKIGLSEEILRKPGILTSEETSIIRRHPVIGEDICRPLKSLKQILPAVRSHHERWDGAGFPDGLAGSEIPLMARILSVLDSYDAIVSVRPYRDRKPAPRALAIMEAERLSGQWDPELSAEFIGMMKSSDLQEATHA